MMLIQACSPVHRIYALTLVEHAKTASRTLSCRRRYQWMFRLCYLDRQIGFGNPEQLPAFHQRTQFVGVAGWSTRRAGQRSTFNAQRSALMIRPRHILQALISKMLLFRVKTEMPQTVGSGGVRVPTGYETTKLSLVDLPIDIMQLQNMLKNAWANTASIPSQSGPTTIRYGVRQKGSQGGYTSRENSEEFHRKEPTQM